MSQSFSMNTQASLQSVIGNTAKTLRNFQPLELLPGTAPGEPRRRTPLSLVPAAPNRRRAPLVILCFLALVSALAAVLVLNVSVSTGQYELVQLRNEQMALAQQNQSLTQQVENRLAPQNLAVEAAELGMVASSTSGSINLRTLKVSGNPERAQRARGTRALVAAPDVVDPSAIVSRPVQDRAAAPESAWTAVSADSLDRESPERQSQATPVRTERTGTVPKRPARVQPRVELNGGTIPAPTQRTGQ